MTVVYLPKDASGINATYAKSACWKVIERIVQKMMLSTKGKDLLDMLFTNLNENCAEYFQPYLLNKLQLQKSFVTIQSCYAADMQI